MGRFELFDSPGLGILSPATDRQSDDLIPQKSRQPDRRVEEMSPSIHSQLSQSDADVRFDSSPMPGIETGENARSPAPTLASKRSHKPSKSWPKSRGRIVLHQKFIPPCLVESMMPC
jgi:hypothetical protein